MRLHLPYKSNIGLKKYCTIRMPGNELLRNTANLLFSYNPLFFAIPLHYPLSFSSIKLWAAGSRKVMQMEKSLHPVTVKCVFLAVLSWPRHCETLKNSNQTQTACGMTWHSNVWYTKRLGSKEKTVSLLDSSAVLTSIQLCFNWELTHMPTFLPLTSISRK